MKSFDLEKALAGEPVRLRDGSKAYVKYVMPDDYKGVYPLRGFYRFSVSDTNYVDIVWTKEGKNFHSEFTSGLDIIGMWEEPRPRVQLDLPAPLEEPQEGMWYIRYDLVKAISTEKGDKYNPPTLETGLYFATKEEALEWITAMHNARKKREHDVR